MLRWLVARRVASEERRVGVPLHYVRHILRTSRAAFIRYVMFIPMSRYRKRLPADAFHVARIVATRAQDCGTCLQIVINLARRDRVPTEIISAALDRRIDSLPAELQDVYQFTTAVVEATYDEEPLRERLRERYGEEGLIEMAFAIATAQMFPVTKRALGYAVSCSKVRIEL